MNEIVDSLKIKLTDNELSNLSKTLVTCYNPYALQPSAWDTLNRVFPIECKPIIKEFENKYIPNEIFNAVIFRYYKGESVVKYNLAMKYLNNPDEVSVFETVVDSSRLDYSRINGQSYAYEIKTELDNTDRLDKQISDYEKVFENIYVISHTSHLKKVKSIISKKCGIISYEIENGTCTFEEIRKPYLNRSIKKESQIRNLNSQDYMNILKHIGVKDVPGYKEDREKLVRKSCNKEEMNQLFKYAMKLKNKEKWEYVKNNIGSILPIDIQDFFTYMKDPKLVYYRTSSIDLM